MGLVLFLVLGCVLARAWWWVIFGGLDDETPMPADRRARDRRREVRR